MDDPHRPMRRSPPTQTAHCAPLVRTMALHRRTCARRCHRRLPPRGLRPTARAVDGLEKTLAGLNLLDDDVALDLRRPQEHFHRLWSIGFHANDLARAADNHDFDEDGDEEIPA